MVEFHYKAIGQDGKSRDGVIDAPGAEFVATRLRAQGLTRFALVADIEGGEAAIIDKDEPALRNCEQIVIELHATQLDGRDVSIDDLVRNIEARGLALTARHGPVCVFERTGA